MSNFNIRNITDDRQNNSRDSGLSQLLEFVEIEQSVLATEVTIIIILNLLVLTLYFRMKKDNQKKIPTFLLFNQSIVDLFIGIVIIPRIICVECRPSKSFEAYHFFIEYSIYLAMGLLMVSTIERALCVKVPFHHRRYITRGKLLVAVLIVWMLTATPAAIFSYLVINQKGHLVTYYYEATSIFLLISLLFIYVLLESTYYTIRASLYNRLGTIQSTAQSSADANKTTIMKEHKKQIRLTLLFLSMTIIYTLTILPSIVSLFLVEEIKLTTMETYHLKTMPFYLYTSSSFINPILTLVFKPEFRSLICCFQIKEKKAVSQQKGSSDLSVVSGNIKRGFENPIPLHGTLKS